MRARRTLAIAIPAVLAGCLLAAWAFAAQPNGCLHCHSQLDDPRLSEPAKRFAGHDVHASHDLGCVGCHGGNPADSELTAMDPDKGFRGKPERKDVAELCAKCHANAEFMKHYNPRPYIFSLAEFRTSVHCKKIAEGDTKVATCTNCHGAHGILSPKDPDSPVYPKNVPTTCAKCHNPVYMKGRNIPTNQHDLYVQSVHGKALLEKGDLSAPACNDCHGNHGAFPPGLRDVSMVCGTCHVREAELFDKSRVKDMMDQQGKRACVTCHSNHNVQPPTDAMLSPGPGGVCGQCHKPGSPGDRAAHEIVTRFTNLHRDMARADSLLQAAETRGMETEAARATLHEARDQATNVRAALHSFDRGTITGILAQSEKLLGQSTGEANRLLRDWRNRRVGMALSLVAILILMGLLILRIRRLDRPAESSV